MSASEAARLLDHRVEDRLMLTVDGRIIHFLNVTVSRPNTAEERVRQNYARTLADKQARPIEANGGAQSDAFGA